MVDFQDPNLIAIIIIDILGISIFIWFLASRLSMKFKVIEERKSKKKKTMSTSKIAIKAKTLQRAKIELK